MKERQALLPYPYEEFKFYVFGTSLSLAYDGKNQYRLALKKLDDHIEVAFSSMYLSNSPPNSLLEEYFILLHHTKKDSYQ